MRGKLLGQQYLKPFHMCSNVVGEHASIRSTSLVNTVQVYAILGQNLKIHFREAIIREKKDFL